MQPYGTLLGLLLACTLGLGAQSLHEVTFIGPLTGDSVRFNIYLPAGYATATTAYPVVYHLHGAGGNHGGAQVVQVPNAFAAARQAGITDRDFILVFPDGGAGSMWADSKSGHVLAETHVIQEIIPYVDANYLTLPQRAHRYVQGFSMGGFGAAKFAAKFPELFQSAVSYDGALHNWSNLVANRPEIAADMFENDSTYFELHAPWHYYRANAANLSDSICLRMNVGALTEYNQEFRDSLLSWGMAFDYLETTCPHALGCLLNQDGLAAIAFQVACMPLVSASAEPVSTPRSYQLYPNPATDLLYWQSAASSMQHASAHISLYDTQGRCVQQWKSQQQGAPLPIGSLRAGLYLVRIASPEGAWQGWFSKK